MNREFKAKITEKKRHTAPPIAQYLIPLSNLIKTT